MGILEKHADQNYYDRTFNDFAGRLERGEIGVKMILPWDTYGSECSICEEKVIAFRYKGERYDLHESAGYFIIHQCPPAEQECWPDDPNVRDSDGNMRAEGWSDDSWGEPRSFADDPYNYPDVPYCPPNWEKS